MKQVIVETKELTKSIKGQDILKGINIDIVENEIHSFIGANGAGKTTTLRCILGLLKPTSGECLIFGQPSYILDNDVKNKIGVVLDEGGIYEKLSAKDNLLFYGRVYGLTDEEILTFWNTNCEKFKLTDHFNKKVKDFSKGMRQNLKIMKEVMHKPQILFLDEPFSGLDPNARIALRDLLLQLKEQNISIFLISHDLHEVEKISDRISMIENGQIEFTKKVSEIATLQQCYTIHLSNINEGIQQLNQILEVEIISRNDTAVTVIVKDETINLTKLLINNDIAFQEIYLNKTNLEKFFRKEN